MVRISERNIFSAFLVLFALILMLSTTGMRGDVALVPRIMGISMLVLSLIQFVLDTFPLAFKKIRGIEEDAIVETKTDIKRRYLLIAWIVIFIIFIVYLNMISAIFISLFLYLKFIIKERWLLSVMYPAIATLVIYLLFVVGMGVHYFI